METRPSEIKYRDEEDEVAWNGWPEAEQESASGLVGANGH